MSSSPCSDNFLVGGPNAWFYFNQPITQIDGYQANEPQVLMHGGNTGLMWKTVSCSSVIHCIKLDENTNELVLEQKQIFIIHDAGRVYDCPNIPLTTCSTQPSGTTPTPTPTPTGY